MSNNVKSGMTFSQSISAFVKRSPARMAVIISVLIFAVTVLLNHNALNITTFYSLFLLTTMLSIAAAGQTMVLICGGLDFTVGAVMSCAAIIGANIMDGQDGRLPLVLLVALSVGALVGLANGVCTIKIGLPPMIVTMAVSNVVTRLQYVFTGGSTPGIAGPAFQATVSGRLFGVIPNSAIYALIVWPLMFFLLNRSSFGKQVYLVGNNPEAARLNGIKVNKIKTLAYVFSGILSAFAGLIGIAYLQTARCQVFDGYAFNSLVAVIVGGTSFNGGVGTYGGSIAGALLMTVLSNALTSLQFSQPVRNIVQGAVMVLLLIMYNREKAVRQ